MKEACPHCGAPMKIRTWHEEGWLVETDKQCGCGYHYNESYGHITEEEPKEEEEEESDNQEEETDSEATSEQFSQVGYECNKKSNGRI